MTQERTVAWFSAGAASAVATKLALAEAEGETVVAYIDTGSEHTDNARFIEDVGAWLDHPVTVLKSDRYADTWQVWEERRFLVSPAGALCTAELKRRPRLEFQRPDDRHVFGFTAEESHRLTRLTKSEPGLTVLAPLVDRGLSKPDTLAIIEAAGITLPAMYRLGYTNANCVGCVKGGMGYWNRIRRDFPETFERMAKLERSIGASIIRADGDSVYLDELNPTRGRHDEQPAECSLLCSLALDELGEG